MATTNRHRGQVYSSSSIDGSRPAYRRTYSPIENRNTRGSVYKNNHVYFNKSKSVKTTNEYEHNIKRINDNNSRSMNNAAKTIRQKIRNDIQNGKIKIDSQYFMNNW